MLVRTLDAPYPVGPVGAVFIRVGGKRGRTDGPQQQLSLCDGSSTGNIDVEGLGILSRSLETRTWLGSRQVCHQQSIHCGDLSPSMARPVGISQAQGSVHSLSCYETRAA